MAARVPKRVPQKLTPAQKERLKDPTYLMALRAVAPVVRQRQKAKRQAPRSAP
tara:strand:- start:270 stop:428 length:159 start_codon:yes stop_codon:yes gene_type:complete